MLNDLAFLWGSAPTGRLLDTTQQYVTSATCVSMRDAVIQNSGHCPTSGFVVDDLLPQIHVLVVNDERLRHPPNGGVLVHGGQVEGVVLDEPLPSFDAVVLADHTTELVESDEEFSLARNQLDEPSWRLRHTNHRHKGSVLGVLACISQSFPPGL